MPNTCFDSSATNYIQFTSSFEPFDLPGVTQNASSSTQEPDRPRWKHRPPAGGCCRGYPSTYTLLVRPSRAGFASCTGYLHHMEDNLLHGCRESNRSVDKLQYVALLADYNCRGESHPIKIPWAPPAFAQRASAPSHCSQRQRNDLESRTMLRMKFYRRYYAPDTNLAPLL